MLLRTLDTYRSEQRKAYEAFERDPTHAEGPPFKYWVPRNYPMFERAQQQRDADLKTYDRVMYQVYEVEFAEMRAKRVKLGAACDFATESK